MIKDIVDFKSLQIKLASSEEIRSWSHGEVKKPETINYRTLKPEKDGLFCERIFGPTKDWECYCGKYKKIRYKGIICDKCGVEVTHSRVRRERMGHISLAAPVAHIWFFKSTPSAFSLLLGLPVKVLEAIVYFAQYLVLEVDSQKRKKVLAAVKTKFQKKKATLKQVYQEKVELEREKLKQEEKKVVTRIKSKEKQVLALEECRLKAKQKIQAILDEEILEVEKLEQLQDRLYRQIQNLEFLSILSEDEYLNLADYQATGFFKAGMGAEALLKAFEKIDLNKLARELRKESKKSKGARYLKASKRLRLVERLKEAKVEPDWMILRIIPVIPPDLRPMVQLSGGRFATSDLNDLYRRVINRNNRLKHLVELGAPEVILRNEKRMLQEAVDNLIDTSRWASRGQRALRRTLRSLSDMLRGKQGRFRRNLLGKRVDYSGRSVIVIGPQLKLNQCGLPKEMALEMFKPYILREMIFQGLVPNVRSAKNMLETRPPAVFDILEQMVSGHPVLLNRAPTLHKLGILAFYPELVEGSAIRIPACVCAGFNADFDGDQMAIHVPLSENAQKEANELMTPENNLLKPADGSPISIPDAHEMAVGVYWLTSIDSLFPPPATIFCAPAEAFQAYQNKKIKLRQEIRVKIDDRLVKTSVGRLLLNEVLPKELGFINEAISRSTMKTLFTRVFASCASKKIVKLIDDLKDLGFEAGTIAGYSVSIFDCQKLEDKDKIIRKAEKEVAQIEENYQGGLITEEEKKRLIQEVWITTTEDLADRTWAAFTPDNPVKLVADAGVGRVSRDQIKQLSAMRGLVVDPLGRIVSLPTKSNFRDGLSVFEYVSGARGSRKGLTDTALKTSDAGYLTRRLVDVAHNAIIREEDCRTKKGIEISREGPRGKMFFQRVLGRVLAQEVISPKTKKTLLKRGEEIDEKTLGVLEENKIQKVVVRSPLTCQSRYGICARCYGWDFATRKMVGLGTPVGVLAAQSIGEPGTQLTLRTKHIGGVVGVDVTQGLPRVEELLEVRIPKVLSPLAEITGKAKVLQTSEGYQVKIKEKGKKGKERTYSIPATSVLKVEDGQEVEVGQQLASGALDIREVLAVKGLRAAQEYLIGEIQAVYDSQGIPIHDKHFEVTVSQMSQKVKVVRPGKTDLLPGELVDRIKVEKMKNKAKGKDIVCQDIILGLTKASLNTESWLSAASFQNTTTVLAQAALEGKEDYLLGLKENVIIGRLIPVTPERAKIKS